MFHVKHACWAGDDQPARGASSNCLVIGVAFPAVYAARSLRLDHCRPVIHIPLHWVHLQRFMLRRCFIVRPEKVAKGVVMPFLRACHHYMNAARPAVCLEVSHREWVAQLPTRRLPGPLDAPPDGQFRVSARFPFRLFALFHVKHYSSEPARAPALRLLVVSRETCVVRAAGTSPAPKLSRCFT